MFKDGDIMYIFLRNRVLRLRQKNRSCSVYHRGPPNASLETVPPLTIGKTVPPGESWQCTTKTGDTY